MPSTNATSAPAYAGIPAAAQVTALQQVREYPAVSLLLSTTPAAALTPADDIEHPDVIDDAVDELIELVLTRGGWIAFTRPGTLEQHQGVALSTRP